MSNLSRFAQHRNWLIARMRGAISIFCYSNMYQFSPDIRKEAIEIENAIIKFEEKISRSWELQKHYFQEYNK